MATYITSDIYEASALIIYGNELKEIMVDRSKENRPEALFKFSDSVDTLPHDYRANNMLVDAKGFKTVITELRRKMFSALDGEAKIKDKR